MTLGCAGCAEIAGFIALAGYDGDVDDPTCVVVVDGVHYRDEGAGLKHGGNMEVRGGGGQVKLYPLNQLERVAGATGISVDQIRGSSRRTEVVLARHVAMYLLREEAHCTLAYIGRILGGRDHSTVLHGCRRVETIKDSDPLFRTVFERLRDA